MEGPGRTGEVSHHFTVDVEEYFHVSAFEAVVSQEQWVGLESRVAASTELILRLLEEQEARATFFVLGWVALRHPELIRRIAAEGHEIASHGWDHRRIPHQTPLQFRNSVRATRELLEDLTGTPVVGFRAPSFSVGPGDEWALDVLLEEGHKYDSSLFPIRRPGYGYPDGGRFPHRVRRPGGDLLEFPPATLRRLGVNIPAAGGAYLRFFPLWLIRAAIRDMEWDGEPAVLYIHPWELDPEQPRLPVSMTTRLRHYSGLDRTRGLVQRLLEEFRFRTISSTPREIRA
ncbi:MAG: DUF3473 domain-containing protein [Longimicrobiales bacterium]|nr:DUF3473 domain-containing protein [Longimicrobiales bacterium]